MARRHGRSPRRGLRCADHRLAGPALAPATNRPAPAGKDFVDFDEDQTVADLLNAIDDGFDDPELAKRYTTATMGPSQGRISALNTLLVLRDASPLGAEAGERGDAAPACCLPESFGHLPAGASSQPGRPRCTTSTWRLVRR